MASLQKRLKESVQLRLSVALALAILIVAVAAGVFAFASAFEEAHELQDDTLRQVAALFEHQQLTPAPMRAPPTIEGDDEESRVIVQSLNQPLPDPFAAAYDDRRGGPLPLPTTLHDGLATVEVGGEPFRVLVRTTARGERIAVAQESGARDKDARESAWRSLLPFLILFPVLLLVVSDLVRKLFRPIAQLSAEIDQRAEQALHPIDERPVPIEVRPFVVAINRLLERVGAAMETQRRFVADAAHELRSPLTALSLQAERLAAVPMPDTARERLQPLRLGIERGRNLVDQLLSLAAAQSTARAPVQGAVSVHQVFRRVLENLHALAEAKGIDIGVEGEQDAHVLSNELDLLTLVRNLVDNALRYTPDGGRVDLAVAVEGGWAQVIVSDNGPGIAAPERERVFEPFHRGLGTDEVGSGLGLAIVKAIAERAGGQVRLGDTDPQNATGLTVTVTLPIA